MKLLNNAGYHELITGPERLQRELLDIEMAGRNAYQSQVEPITLETARDFIRARIHDPDKDPHYSIIEFGILKVKFWNVSRGMTHELVRHRPVSYLQESTRYVDYAKKDSKNAARVVDLERFDLKCVVPPHHDMGQVYKVDGLPFTLPEMLEVFENFYRALRKSGMKAQDARQVLPIATKANICVSTNFVAWRHIFKMRTGKPAHWEIRQVMCGLLKDLKNIEFVNVIFEDFHEAGFDGNGVPYYEIMRS